MDADELRRLYEQLGSCSAVARMLDVPIPTMRNRLIRAGVSLRTGFRSPKAVRHYGPDHRNWKGGTYIMSNGYVMAYAPEHPDASKGKGYVLQHRLVMERVLGRYLTGSEIVHHRNEDKQDNRPENLELLTRSKHMKLHKDGYPRDEVGRFSS